MTSPNDRPAFEFAEAALPYQTSDLPGIGGRLKQSPDDFLVEEIPAYRPCGEGEHLFLWIEKRDVSAEQLTQHLARVLGVPAGSIGVAGLKDRQAVTRQYVSVPAACSEDIPQVETDQIHVLSAERHTNKLRTGHLRGNRFEILVRDVVPEALERAEAIAGRIRADGCPHYFGTQRFGIDGETVRTGLALLRGEKRPRQLPAPRRKFLLRLSLSAVQSWLFNRVLADRLQDGLLRTVLPGDVLQVIASGGCFVAEDVAAEQPRVEGWETVVTGPMFGPKMKQPAGVPAEREAAVLQKSGLTFEAFGQFPKLTSGARRALVIQPADLSLASAGDGLRFALTLPPGAYATVVLREFQKTDLF